MGVLDTLAGAVGFGFGIPIGLLLGYLLFICFKPDEDVKDPAMRPLCELDTNTLRQLLPDIPLWVKNPDYERVDWMNKFAICDAIRSTAKPIFDEYIGKFRLESIEFEHLTLGSFPPTVSGMKVYEVQDKELIIEPWVRWAGNTNIVIGLRWLSLKMSVQLTDLQISLAPRITLKPLVPTFPCFSKIFISLMEKPHIDFGLKLLGADIMSIPGLHRLVQDTIKEQVSNLYHWPQYLEVPILDGSCANTKKPVGILHVKVVRAVNLRKMDILGKSDPYVKLSLSGERLPSKKTTIKMNNLNPEWNEQFKLIVKDPKTQVLQLHAYDWEKVKSHDKLGMQVVPLSMLTPNETEEFTLDLLKNLNPNDPQNRKNRGKITVELRFDPFKEDTNKFSGILDRDGNDSYKKMNTKGMTSQGGVLLVTIERAEDVEGKHHTNPYAVIHFGGEMRKTKRIHKAHDPRWNEEFQFVLEEEPIDKKIHIEVLSKKRGFTFFWKETLGHVEVNLTDVVHNGRINQKYHLVNSRNGVIHVEIRWSTV